MNEKATPGQAMTFAFRHLPTGQGYAEWRVWLDGAGYDFDDDSYQAEAFAAGMRAARRQCARELHDYAAGLMKDAMAFIIDGDEANGLPKVSRAAAIDSAAKILDPEHGCKGAGE